MNPSPPPATPQAVLETLEGLYRTQPTNLPAIAEAGLHAQRLGMEEASRGAFDHTTDLLRRIIAVGHAEAALEAELMIYKAFVKAVEDEDHYEQAFARWREPMAALGRRHARPLASGARDTRKIAFVFHSGTVLGHTEVLLRLLENLDRSRFEARVFTVSISTPEFNQRVARIGIALETFPEVAGAPHTGMVERMKWLRGRIDALGYACAVWVSLPIAATFLFAMRVAPVQIFWSLKHHPVRLPEIDGYITYGSWGEREKTFHGQVWQVAPVPLALDPRVVTPGARADIRAKYPHRILLGSLAREEKIDSRPFLEAVATILEHNPDAGYLWTGRNFHPGIAAFFAGRGLAQRAHFVGWVDTAVYAAALDLFLETFPFGCGITGYQALAAGVPLVSYLEENTVFGMQYWSDVMERGGSKATVSRELLDQYPVLCARNPAEYVEIVDRMLGDPAFRESWRERESAHFQDEIRNIARYSERFFQTIAAIAARKAAA
ncbi:MAG: hypothetical protein ABIQ72_15125 [Usitatibacter sp.]